MSDRRRIVVGTNSALTPVLRLLTAGRDDRELLTLHPEYAQSLADLDLPARPLASEATHEMRREGFKEAARILATLEPPRNGLPPNMLEFMRDELGGWLYPRMGELTLLPIALEAARPDLVVLHNDVEPLTRCVALWARAAGVPCLHVPHAIIMDWEHGQPGSDIHDIVTASHVAAAGPFQREWYRSRTDGDLEIRETGLPQFDAWAAMDVNRDRARRLFKIKSHAPVVCYASSWSQKTNLLGCHGGVEETYLAFLEAAKRLPDCRFVVKTHPHGRNEEWHAKMAAEAEVECAVTPHHLALALQASDLLLAYGPSNVLLEAAHLPHLRLAATAGYPDDGVVVKVEDLSPDGMAKAISEVLGQEPPDTGTFLRKYVGEPDGGAAERVAAFAEELLA